MSSLRSRKDMRILFNDDIVNDVITSLALPNQENLGNECKNSTIFRKTLVPSPYVTVRRVTDLRFRSNIKENFSKEDRLGILNTTTT